MAFSPFISFLLYTLLLIYTFKFYFTRGGNYQSLFWSTKNIISQEMLNEFQALCWRETGYIGMKKTQYMKNGYTEIKRQKSKRLKVYTHTHTQYSEGNWGRRVVSKKIAKWHGVWAGFERSNKIFQRKGEDGTFPVDICNHRLLQIASG